MTTPTLTRKPLAERLPTKYRKMTRNQFGKLMSFMEIRGELTPHQRGVLWEQYDAYQDTRQQELRRVDRTRRAWQPLLEAVSNELYAAKGSRNYYQFRAQRHDRGQREAALAAYTAYIEALENAYLLMKAGRHAQQTPSQFVQFLHTHKGVEIPNKGSFWTDWVPPKKKAKIRAMFEAIPYPPGAKRRVIFPERDEEQPTPRPRIRPIRVNPD